MRVIPDNAVAIVISPDELTEIGMDEAMRIHDATGCLIIVAEPGTSLHSLDIEQMAANGWIRAATTEGA